MHNVCTERPERNLEDMYPKYMLQGLLEARYNNENRVCKCVCVFSEKCSKSNRPHKSLYSGLKEKIKVKLLLSLHFVYNNYAQENACLQTRPIIINIQLLSLHPVHPLNTPTPSLSISPPLNATMAVFIRPRFETWIGGMEGPEVIEECVCVCV